MSFLTGVDLTWSWGRGRLTQGGIPTVVTSLFGSITSHLDTGHSSWLVETKAIPVRCHMEVVVRPVGARVYTHREGQGGWLVGWRVGWRGGWRGNGRGCWWKCGRGVGWCLFFKRVKPECVRVYTQRDATPGFSLCQLHGLSANHTQLLRNTCKVNVYILKMFEGSSETDLFHMDQARCTSSMTHFDRGIAHFRAFFLSFLPLSNSLYTFFLSNPF